MDHYLIKRCIGGDFENVKTIECDATDLGKNIAALQSAHPGVLVAERLHHRPKPKADPKPIVDVKPVEVKAPAKAPVKKA